MAAACGRSQAVSKTRLTITASGSSRRLKHPEARTTDVLRLGFSTLAQLCNSTSERAKQGYKKKYGVWPDGMTFGQILNQADQLAWDQIRQDWIQPYTDQAAELASEMEDDQSPHQRVIDNPETWPTNWAVDLTYEVWPYPTSPNDHKLIQEFEQQINQMA